MTTKITTWICLLITSIGLVFIGLFIINGYYQPMVIGAALGMAIPTIIRITQYIYYHQPSKEKQLHQKIVAETIEKTDERVLMLKQKASSWTMQVMIVILLAASFVSALLKVHYLFTLVLFVLLILLMIIWFVSYKVLDKKY